MSEQVGAHGAPLGGALSANESANFAPELESSRSAAAPFDLESQDSEQTESRGWRPWAIIGAAIAIPTVAAAALVLTLSGGSDTEAVAPAETAIVEEITPAPIAVEPEPATATTVLPVAVAPSPTPASVATTTSALPPVPATAAAAESVAAELATSEERLADWGEMFHVVVIEGDSVWGLAAQYDTTVEAIVFVNALDDPTALSVGQSLGIPVGFNEALSPPAVEATSEPVSVVEAEPATESAAAPPTPTTGASSFTSTPSSDTALEDWPNIVQWTIEPGDNLWALATTFETTQAAIVALNEIENPDLLVAGVTLTIPVGFSGETPVATPAAITDESAMIEDDVLTPSGSVTLMEPTDASDDLQGSPAPIAPANSEDDPYAMRE